MEAPACPVCFDPYDGDRTIPRVLSCGHSVCQLCLSQIPKPFSGSIRCPECTQFVPLSHPTSLPKNISLLRFVDPLQKTKSSRSSKRPTDATSNFVTHPWNQDFYSVWRPHILPENSIIVTKRPSGDDCCTLLYGKLTCSLSSSRTNKQVTLLPIAKFCLREYGFRPSYHSLLVGSLYSLSERRREELKLLILISGQARFCRICGLWMDVENGYLCLASERLEMEFPNILDGLNDPDSFVGFAIASMEMCEALMSLHSEHVIMGFLSVSCFRLDCCGHFFLDFNEAIISGRMINKVFAANKVSDISICTLWIIAPEILKLLHSNGPDTCISFASDVWSLSWIFVAILIGSKFVKEYLECFLSSIEEHGEIPFNLYNIWMKQLALHLSSILGTKFEQLNQMLIQCLDYMPERRLATMNLWECLRGLLMKTHFGFYPIPGVSSVQEIDGSVMILSGLCLLLTDNMHNQRQMEAVAQEPPDIIKGFLEGRVKSLGMERHRDCITGLTVAGGYLFSSSFDKIVNVWSLKDFSLVNSLKGHEHKITAVVAVNVEFPLCISGDSGAFIFVWGIYSSRDCRPLTFWKEHSDWRYSGVHCLASSGSELLYSGSGDKSIKVWSLKDFSLVSTMTGHESAVSCLAVSSEVLYSGSWDGTVRLWLLSDCTPLAVLSEDLPNSPVLSLVTINNHMLAVSHENGSVKVWKNDYLFNKMENQEGAILCLAVAGIYLLMGGWNKVIDVQEALDNKFESEIRPMGSIACDAIITALLYWEQKLFVGFADNNIKVFYC